MKLPYMDSPKYALPGRSAKMILCKKGKTGINFYVFSEIKQTIYLSAKFPDVRSADDRKQLLSVLLSIFNFLPYVFTHIKSSKIQYFKMRINKKFI